MRSHHSQKVRLVSRIKAHQSVTKAVTDKNIDEKFNILMIVIILVQNRRFRFWLLVNKSKEFKMHHS